MYQVNFSNQAMGALNKLDKIEQLELIDMLGSIDIDALSKDKTGIFGKFKRSGIEYYRLRAGEYRIYFELKDGTIFAHYFLNQHTIADFVFRSKLPYKEETMIEQTDHFWTYIDSLK